MLSGGWLTDRFQAAFGVRLGRAIVPVAGLLFSAVWLLLGVGAQDLFWVVTFLSLATAAIGSCEASFWIMAIDLGGRRGGTAAAVLNTGGNIAGFVAPTLTPLVGETFGWKYAMGLASVICVAGAALWLWVDPADRCRDEEVSLGVRSPSGQETNLT
jgi:MFS family permease